MIKPFFNRNNTVDISILAFIGLFLLGFFEPKYLFSLTTTTGGDTGSHYLTAEYLKQVLLPKGQIMGWLPGNYAGFPLFYHYFPLPFILMVMLSYVIPLQIAFKLISVLGIFLLPPCAYFCSRLLKYPFPIPILSALFTLPFLFMEANSMWGSNIPSTLAGEFSYGIGISLAFLFFGTLYAGIKSNKLIILNAFLLLLIGQSHGYSIIFAGIIGSYFLFTKKYFWSNIKYLSCVFSLGILLLGFWLLPFCSTLPWVTEYVAAWGIKSIFEIFPRIIIPSLILSLLALFLNLFDRRTWYFLYCAAVCLVLYFIGPRIGILDIRFVPILQIFISIFGSTTMLAFVKEIKGKQMLPFIAFCIITLWIVFNVTYIKGWIKWNYEGFEGKASWPLYKQINDYLSTNGAGRVVYEHSPLHNTFGTERAFESLPLFAKRETLEGLYMQSSPSSPFVFYLQSQVSKVRSGPFPNYQYSKLNLAEALPRLKLFNVSQLIIRTPEAKAQAKALPKLKLEKTIGDYEIYRLTANTGRYVVPLKFEPIVYSSLDWKMAFFDWFRTSNNLDLHFVHLTKPSKEEIKRFKAYFNSPENMEPIPIIAQPPQISEKLGNDYLEFTTNLVGLPHLVKISYHPNWQVEGADKIYLVSPAFMLVYPSQNHVRLYFGKTLFNYVGEAMTLIGLIICVKLLFGYFKPRRGLS